jgi:hypothetical protein
MTLWLPSTTEAEYGALTRAAQSALHFLQLLQVIHHHELGPTTVYEDYNDDADKFANNPMTSHMTKHIDIRHPCTKKLVDARAIAVISISTSYMLADGLTKALPQSKHTMLVKRCLESSD